MLLSQYSFTDIVLILILFAVCVKFVWSIGDFFWDKIRKRFNLETEKQQQHNEITQSLTIISDRLDEVNLRLDKNYSEMEEIKREQKTTISRLQENTKSYIIDKYHVFCYQYHEIDDMNLQNLERRYLYYKAAGGNSYIDGLMEEIRSLPRASLENKYYHQSGEPEQ